MHGKFKQEANCVLISGIILTHTCHIYSHIQVPPSTYTHHSKMVKSEELVLLDFWPSMFGMRPRIALAEKGIPYESSEQDLTNKSQLLLDMNPIHKKIPVLIHNGNPISESKIILEYIDEAWNDKPPLLPSDTYGKANARFWADFIDKKIFVNGGNFVLPKGEDHETSRKEFIDSLKLLEGELGDKPYFGGECFGYLDVCLITYYPWFHTFETYGNLNIEQQCPNIITWAKSCIQNKESVSNTLPDPLKVCAFAKLLRKKYGVE